MTQYTFHATISSIRALNPLEFPNTSIKSTQIPMRSRVPSKYTFHASQTFHAITSPIQVLNPLKFPNTTRSDRFDSLEQQHV
ncbi:uncharacterized protein G2W53_033411 [Senna tora]|uniref:Uncharacterized protein n=1 Tax=Senna tora TaxID=362788 RepID=A0A834W6Z4_9FABA|nr:uncharacterized protein G2W53_033411 [Senna tora]